MYLTALLFKYLKDSVKDTRNNMKPRTYVPLGRLISDVLIESGLVDHLIHHNLMKDVTIDIGRPLNTRNLKSMGVIEQIRVKPLLDTTWEAFNDHRKIPNSVYLFSKIDPLEVVAYYLQDLPSQGVDISEFYVDWLLERPPNFMKRQREPSRKSKKAKKAKFPRREAEEKDRLEEEQRVREVANKVVAEAADAAAAAAKAEAKAKVNAEEAARIAAEEAAKASADALAQGEQSNSGFTPLVLKTLEEMQKDQQIVRARLDHQDSVNNNIQNLLTQLLKRMPPPPNP